MEQIEVRVLSRNFGCRMGQRRRRETRGGNYNNLTRIRSANNYNEKTPKQNKAILPKICMVILGDFNHLNIQDLVIIHNLKQVVTRPTRQDSILDYIITNLKSFTKHRIFLLHLDHNVIMWIPKDICKDNNNMCTERTVRRYPQSGLNGFGLWSTRNEWFSGRMIQIEIKTRKNHFYTKKSITCGKTMSVNGGILLTQCQAERKVNLSLQLSVTDN